jgi:hypothetical protein
VQRLQGPDQLGAHLRGIDHEPHHRGVESGLLCAWEIEVEAEGSQGHPVLVSKSRVVSEEPAPEERVEVQIQDQAVAVECQRLGGYGREGRTPATACGNQTAGCRERLPEEATAR